MEPDQSNLSARIDAAMDPAAPPEQLALLAGDQDQSVRGFVARNMNTPPEQLALLAEDEGISVRRGIAWNPATLPQTLALLASDHDQGVRAAVAGNPNAPPEGLALLTGESRWQVRRFVAYHPNATPETLLLLAADEDEDVRECAARNPNATLKVFVRLIFGEKYTRIMKQHEPHALTQALTEQPFQVSSAFLEQTPVSEILNARSTEDTLLSADILLAAARCGRRLSLSSFEEALSAVKQGLFPFLAADIFGETLT